MNEGEQIQVGQVDLGDEQIKKFEDFRTVRMPAIPAGTTVRSAQMEIEAVALYKQYGLFLPGPAKSFFRKLAFHLNWQDLLKVTK